MTRQTLLGKFISSNGWDAVDDKGNPSSPISCASPRIRLSLSPRAAPSPSTDESMTIQALSNALTEMNTELRSKAVECEALQETVATLADSLHTTDVRLEEALVENERLHLKLQAVCFCERGDDEEADLEEDQPFQMTTIESKVVDTDKQTSYAMLSHPGYRKQLQMKTPAIHQASTEATTNVKPKKAPAIETQQNDDEIRDPPAEDVVDSNDTDDSRPSSERVKMTAECDETSSIKTSTIRHAAFVRVIRERDEAQKIAKQFKKELMHRRKEVKQLQGELAKTKQLMELVYCNNDEAPDNKGRRRRRNKNWSKRAESTAPMQWLRHKSGRSPHAHAIVNGLLDETADETRDALVSGNEARSKMYMDPFIVSIEPSGSGAAV